MFTFLGEKGIIRDRFIALYGVMRYAYVTDCNWEVVSHFFEASVHTNFGSCWAQVSKTPSRASLESRFFYR